MRRITSFVLAIAVGCGWALAQAPAETKTADESQEKATKGRAHNPEVMGKLEYDKVVTRKGPSGETITHAGKELSGAAEVAVSALLAKPEDYRGKTVQLSGSVSAMCFHERAWFAIAAEDKSGQHVRVMCAPVFLVPEGSVGKKAKCEGVVDVVEVDAEMVKHLADTHKLAEPKEASGPEKQIMVKAVGADFM